MSDSKKDGRVINWAILGTGTIATDMIQILKQLPATSVVAVGSRSIESANRFADKWSIPNRYASYGDACKDPKVNVVYVATPSLRHVQDCLLALENGKAVLCEKSMAPNYEEAKKVLKFAKSKNLLFVHGVWSRFFPAMSKLRQALYEDKIIGDVRSARASFCQNDGAGSCSALLETGIYCAQFLQWVLTEPDSDGGITVRGASRKNHSVNQHLDEHVSALLEFAPDGKMGTFECSLGHCSDRSAVVYGSKGIIEVSFPFWCPTKFRVTLMSGPGSQAWTTPEDYAFPLPSEIKPLNDKFNFVNSEGLSYEAAEMNRCLRDGLLESPSFTSSQCLDIMRIITEIDTISKTNTK